MTVVSDGIESSAFPAIDSAGRPKILHVVTRYLRGGSERRIRDIVGSLPEADHHLVLGHGSDAELARRDIGPASLIVVPTLVREPDPWRDLVTLRRLSRLIGSDGFHLVVTHQSKAGVLGRAAARLASVPVVHSLSMASFGPGYSRWQSAAFRFLESKLARLTAAYVVVGTDLAGRYVEIGVPAEKLHVVRSGVPLPAASAHPLARREVDRRWALPPERPLVLYLGSLEARKNVLALPRLLHDLVHQTTSPRPFLVVAGEGPLAGPLEEGLKAAGVADDARLLGFVPDPRPLVAAADVLVLLSSAEGVPQVLVQAAAAGVPFVAFAADGVKELIDLGAHGVSLPIGAVGAASSATIALLRRGRTPEGAPIDLSAWSTDVITAGHRRVIGQVLASRPARAVARTTRTRAPIC